MDDNVAVVIPAFNERSHIGSVVATLVKDGFFVVVVDDGSADDTAYCAQDAGAVVLRHVVNLGKGAAAKTGADFAVKRGFDVLVLMDADGQHKAKDVPRALRVLDGVDMVFGYRRLNKNMPLTMRLGNITINGLSWWINGVRLRDTQSGFRVLTAEAYRRVRWRSLDYGMESEMIANLAKWRLRFREIPIATIYNDHFKGTSIFDGAKIIFRLLRWRFL